MFVKRLKTQNKYNTRRLTKSVKLKNVYLNYFVYHEENDLYYF